MSRFSVERLRFAYADPNRRARAAGIRVMEAGR